MEISVVDPQIWPKVEILENLLSMSLGGKRGGESLARRELLAHCKINHNY